MVLGELDWYMQKKKEKKRKEKKSLTFTCLLYTSDAADDWLVV